MSDYLSKPIQGKLLHRMVAKFLGKNAVVGRASGNFLVGAPDAEVAGEIASALLGRWPGAYVQTLHTAEAVCIAIGSRLPDCVIVTPDLPGLSVATLSRHLHSDERYREVHLVLWNPQGHERSVDIEGVSSIAEPGAIDDLARLLSGLNGPKHDKAGPATAG